MIGLTVAAMVAASALVQVKRYPYEVVTVTGAAAKNIQSDFAEWTCRFARRANAPASAFKALQSDRAVIVEYLKSVGVTAAEMEVSQIGTTALYKLNDRGDTTNQIEGYELSQTITSRSADVVKIDRAARKPRL